MVTLSEKVLAEIIKDMGSTSYETGGLLGSINEHTIDVFYFDKGKVESNTEYKPNVDALQQQLSKWYEDRITFMGFIHSHESCGDLSLKDIHMAHKIMDINQLKSILMPVYLINTSEIVWHEIKDDGVVHRKMTKIKQ